MSHPQPAVLDWPDPQGGDLSASLASVLELFRVGVVVLNRDGSVMWSNHEGRYALRRGFAVGEVDGAPQDSPEPVALAFQRSIALAWEAARSAAVPVCCGAFVMAVGRRRADVAVMAHPGEGGGAVVLLIGTRRLGATPTLLKRLYGLTPSEARLAAALASGCTLKQSAEKLSIGANTAKTHLRSIFAKTHTRSQSALLRLLSSGLGTVRIGRFVA